MQLKSNKKRRKLKLNRANEISTMVIIITSLQIIGSFILALANQITL